MSSYNRVNIQKMLMGCFGDDDLIQFAFSYVPSFEHKIGSGIGKQEYVRELIEYCERADSRMKDLLEWARKMNPECYDKHGPYHNLEQAAKIAERERPRIDKLKKFFNLNDHNSIITIYLSRHSGAAKFPEIPISAEAANSSPILNAIHKYQQSEKETSDRSTESPDAFAVVSAVEMLEALYLKDEIEKSPLRDTYPKDIQEESLNTRIIEVKLKVCPEPINYQNIFSKGTNIFIGGPRANLGTFYYLYGYGSEAGVVRARRTDKNVIECIHNPDKSIDCDKDYNLALIQKHTLRGSDKTVFYLAGTGVNGTAAAVAYIRKRWEELLNTEQEQNFHRIIQVSGRKVIQEYLATYDLDNWTDSWEDADELTCN